MTHDPLRPINRQNTIKVLERAVRDPSYPAEPKSRARRSLRLLMKVEELRPQRPARGQPTDQELAAETAAPDQAPRSVPAFVDRART